MKILVLSGSSRKGNTYKAVKEIEKQILEYDSSVNFDYFHLNDFNLKFCKSCYLCFDKGEQYCPCNDDLDKIYQKIKNSDGLILASPIYAYSVSGNVKTLFDRLAFIIHRPEFWGKSCLCVATTFAAPGLKSSLKLMKANLWFWGFNVTGRFGITGGTDKSHLNKDFPAKKKVKKIKKLAGAFYKDLKKRKYQKPNFMGLMRFEIQKKTMKNVDSADSDYFKEKGWLKKHTHFYYDTKINFIKRASAKILTNIALKAMNIEK